jgi:hypothetical protein
MTREAAPLASTEARDFEYATMRTVSRHLIPFLFVLQVASYLDRINVGFAQLQMKSALGFSDVTGGFTASLLTVAGLLVGSAVLAVSLRRSPANPPE